MINKNLEIKMQHEGFMYDELDHMFKMYFFGKRVIALSGFLVEEKYRKQELSEFMEHVRSKALYRFMEALSIGLNKLPEDIL